MPVPSTAVLVLFSGGLDSSSCAAFYLERRLKVSGLFIDYGQPAALQEWRAASQLSEHLRIGLRRAVVKGIPCPERGFIPARNALLICMALATTTAPLTGLIALGIHSGTPYPDCTPSFLLACQALADVYANGKLQIAAPFLEWSKAEVVTYAKQAGIPLNMTYSCEAGGPEPCGRCLSCQDRLDLPE